MVTKGTDDHALAARAASGAGEMLMRLREDLFSGRKRHWGWPEEQADEAGHDFLMALLQKARPDDAILSEEGDDGRNRLEYGRVWIVDPLDGSSSFGRGADDWAVHVALVEDGEPIAGAVSLPTSGSVFSTGLSPHVPAQRGKRPVVVTGRSRVHSDGQIVAAALDAELAACSSAGVKAMLVVMGDADVYVHGGPLHEWDVCAPAAVAQAAGLHVSGVNGAELTFNQDHPVSPGLLICRPEYAETVISAMGYAV